MASIQDHRSFYANLIVKSAGSSNETLIAAFSSTKRESYVGKGPWSIFVNRAYITTVSEDARILYQDIVVGLAIDRGINNGQPSLHARCLVACAPLAGESVVHVGSGTGYYTAILAVMTADTGLVTAYEIEVDLADRARKNLRHLPNVKVVNSSASEVALPSADVIYVSAGATHPVPSWLDALNVGGRLIFPLTANDGLGVMLMITRRSAEDYATSVVMPVAFVPCIGARDDSTSRAITAALQTRSIMSVKSLRRGATPDSTACFVGNGWWLSNVECT
jgi:protein-L-isoaspartate(D-aspartate) O-methyltransferase